MRGLLAAMVVGGLFGSASATVVEIDDQAMTVNIEVEVVGAADTVVMHLAFEEEKLLTLPLLDRGDGLFGITTELELKNYAVVFEVVGEQPSEPVSLTQLGAELGPNTVFPTTTAPEEGLSQESRGMLWLAIALGAASLSALAFWVLGGRSEGDRVPAPVDATASSADEEE